MKNITILLVFLMLETWDVTAQESIANTRFYEGVVAEEVTGDLDKALNIYQDLFKVNKSDRILAAKCLYHIGLTYEKKGSDKAIGYYSDVIEKYPDQSDLAELARGRIAKLKDANTFIDPRDGHKYRWVKIGSQIWMAENLAYMPHVNPPKKQEDGIWVYDYDGEDVAEAKATDNYQKYGCLYDWAMAMDIDTKYLEQPWNGNSEKHQGICPPGWHLPTDGEWKTLEKSLGMSDSLADVMEDTRSAYESYYPQSKDYVPVGKYLKSSSGWFQEGNGDNSSGFNIIPSGGRRIFAQYFPWKNFENLGYNTGFWTASDSALLDRNPKFFNQDYTAFERYFYNQTYDIERAAWLNRAYGVSVRCLKDDNETPLRLAGGNISKSIEPSKVKIIIGKVESSIIIMPKLLGKIKLPPKEKLIMGGPAFIIEDSVIYFSDFKSRQLFALRLPDLDTIWTYQANEEFVPYKGIQVTHDVVICQVKNNLVGLNKANGTKVWQRKGPFSLVFSIADGETLYTSNQDTLFSMNASNGLNNWIHIEKGVGYGKINFKDGSLFCPINYPAKIRQTGKVEEEVRIQQPVLMAFNSNSGEKLWEFKSFGNLWQCSVSDNSVLIHLTDVVIGPYIIAVDCKTGKKVWKTYMSVMGPESKIWSDDKALFIPISQFLSDSDEIVKLSTVGEIQWRHKFGRIMGSTNNNPILHDGKLFFLTGTIDKTHSLQSTTLNAVDGGTGSKVYSVKFEGNPVTYPVFFNGKMYIGFSDGLCIYELPKID